ncbi:hypothetical protein Bbelb_225530 [Branchiostoma belcheri]|nr:hypothetical protein Bbelb_225530 [Branchiostoma belcheri]
MEDVWPSSLSWPSGSNSVYSSCQSSCVDITMSELRPREEPAMPAPSCGKPGLCNGLPDISECRESQSSSNPSSELTRQACIHQGNHLNHTPCTYTTLEFEIQDFPPGLNRNAKKKQVPLLLSPCMVVLSLLSFVTSTLSLGMICFDSVYFIWLNHYYGYISELGEIDWIAGIKLSLMVGIGVEEHKPLEAQEPALEDSPLNILASPRHIRYKQQKLKRALCSLVGTCWVLLVGGLTTFGGLALHRVLLENHSYIQVRQMHVNINSRENINPSWSEKLVGIDEIKAATRQGFQLTRKCRSFGMWSSEHQKMLAPKLFYNMTTYALVRKENPCMDNCDIVFRFLYHQHPDDLTMPSHLRFRLAYNVVERTECNNKVFYSNYTPVGNYTPMGEGVSSRETHVGTMTLQFYPETCGVSPIWDNTIKVVDT